jgi:hypothetical protein
MDTYSFTWGDIFWQQLSSTTMGTLAAVLFSKLTVGYQENMEMIPFILAILFSV